MKKLILLVLTAVIMAGCEIYSTEQRKVDHHTIIIIDSCEYIENGNMGGFIYSHKGNCRFCKERRQKELEELVNKLEEK